MTETFPCPACGAPNEPKVGATQMACSYCGANLIVPAELRRAAPPKVEKTIPKATPAQRLEEEAPEFLRKVQPVAAKAWNTFALWTWIRRALPACLVILLIGLCACAILFALPNIVYLIGR